VHLRTARHLLQLAPQPKAKLAQTMRQIFDHLLLRPQSSDDRVFGDALNWLRGQKKEELPGFRIATVARPYCLPSAHDARGSEAEDLYRDLRGRGHVGVGDVGDVVERLVRWL